MMMNRFKNILPVVSNIFYLLSWMFVDDIYFNILMTILAITSSMWHYYEFKFRDMNNFEFHNSVGYLWRRLDVWAIYLIFSYLIYSDILVSLLIFMVSIFLEYICNKYYDGKHRFKIIGVLAAGSLSVFIFESILLCIASLLLFGGALRVRKEAQPDGQYEHSIWHLMTACAIILMA